MGKKYKLTSETITYNSKTLHRIKALKSFGFVRKWDLGGYIEKEDNLSQEGDCWVYHNAKVLDKALISGDAAVYDFAVVSDEAYISDDSIIENKATICGNSNIKNKSVIRNNSYVKDATISGHCSINNNSIINGIIYLSGNICVYDNVEIRANIVLDGEFSILDNAVIKDMSDIIVFKNWWSSGRNFIWTKSNDMWTVGCFYGTGKQLIKKAELDSKISYTEYKRVVDYVKSIKKTYKK